MQPLKSTQGAEPLAFGASLGVARADTQDFALSIDPAWQVFRGPNGGFLAGALLRAMTQELDEPQRRPRVLSVQYLKVPAHGPARIQAQVVRRGRSVAWVSAELHQEGVCASARAAFSGDWQGVEFDVAEPPALPEPEACLPRFPGLPPFSKNFDYRSALSTPMARDGSGRVGGYIRPEQPLRHDPELLAVLSDAWFPSTFAHDGRPVMAASLDLTVHFRDVAALETLAPEDYLVSVFQSRLSTAGFFEEDGELWTRDGRLLAQSRQLATAAVVGAT